MSAQSYTNKRRILAEASFAKAQYNKGLAVNNNSIYATVNCLPNFQQITYIPVCKCPFNGRGAPPRPRVPPCISLNILSGGSSKTVGYVIYDGNCSQNCFIFSGGNSSTQLTCQNTQINEIIYSGGFATTNSIIILSG